MEPILKLEHIQKYYGNGGNVTKAIQDISFSVAEGEFLGIMGASGSGKTTLLNCISTIDTVSAGAIRLDGQDITRLRPKELAKFRRENLGFIFQDFNLLDTLTIGENIALALTIRRTAPQAIDPQVQCACARAIINHPKLVLADEPTGALDSHSAQMLLATLEDMHRQLGATILMVTHDAFSASYAQRILFLRDGAIFSELRRGTDSRKGFFDKILQVLTMMGGGTTDVR